MSLRKLPINSGPYPDYADFMLSYCMLCQYQTIVEIGVYLGDTTIRLCEAARFSGGKVFGYDRFEPIGEELDWKNPIFGAVGVENKLINKGYDKSLFKITKIDSSSDEFFNVLKSDTNGKIDFAFIDGDHGYNGIKNDFLKVYPLLIEDGSIMFHDTYNHNGCRKFVLDLYEEFNDGTFDVLNLPFGFGRDRCGISILSKRSFPLYPTNLSGCHPSATPFISNEEVYKAEKEWFSKQIKKHE